VGCRAAQRPILITKNSNATRYSMWVGDRVTEKEHLYINMRTQVYETTCMSMSSNCLIEPKCVELFCMVDEQED